MCGRYVPPAVGDMERFWNLSHRQSISSIVRRFNVAPTSQVPVIIRGQDATLALVDARWGLVPFWWKQEKLPPMTSCARSEEAAQKPMWRTSLKSQRCIMPALGYYEWNQNELVPGPSGKPVKQPYYHYSPNSEILAIACLWATWNRSDAEPMLSSAVVTREAAPSLAAIHDRMPVILKPEQYQAWLDPRTPANDIQEIMRDSRDDIQYYRVSVAVNNARNDYPELLDELRAA